VLYYSLLGSVESQTKQRVLLELYTNLVWFCRDQCFNREQTSVLISIMKNVHQFSTETPLNNTDQCLTYCSELLLCHSVKRPPFSIDLFNSDQVKDILFYFINSYLRHYFFYKYIFTPEVQLDIHLSYSGMVQDMDQEDTAQSDCTACEERKAEETEMVGEVQPSPEVTNTETKETDCLKSGSSSMSELKALVEKEVKEEVMRLTAQLHQRLQDSTDQLNHAIAKLESNIHGKK
ncbi:hypothetical protein DNTS_028529, partial [Danionella cerebrum]